MPPLMPPDPDPAAAWCGHTFKASKEIYIKRFIYIEWQGCRHQYFNTLANYLIIEPPRSFS